MTMTALTEYLSCLRAKGVALWVDEGRLHYHAGKGVLTEEDLGRLRSMRDEIVTQLRDEAGAAEDPGQTQPPAKCTVPLGFQQQWLLTLIRQHRDWPSVQAFAFRLAGLLKPKLLEASLAAIVLRHDVLRTGLHTAPGQETHPSNSHRMTVVSAVDGSDSPVERRIAHEIRAIVARGIDPTVDPMLQATLLTISKQENCLILVVHRLAADCIAIGQLFRELWLEYGRRLGRDALPFAQKPAQYRDYVIWQQATDGPWQQKHAAFWQEYLAGAQRIRWPVGRARSVHEGIHHGRDVYGVASGPRDDGEEAGTPTGESAAASVSVTTSVQGSLGVELSARLRDMGRLRRSLPALIVLTLYVSAIWRWCGQRDFVVPFNVAGRHAAHDNVVGYFSHVLYLRIRLNGDERFDGLLARVSQEFYKTVFHQDYGRMALRYPGFFGGTFCQWLSWHPAEVAGPEMYEVPAQFGIKAQPVRFQTARELSNVPSGVTDLDICFFEKSGDIGMLLISREELFTNEALERFIDELREQAQLFVTGPRRAAGS